MPCHGAMANLLGLSSVVYMPQPSSLWKLAQCFCRICTTCCFDLEVHGLNHFPRQGGVLVVANHQSYLDPILLGVRLPRPLSYIAKSELFENRHAARLLRGLNGFPVRQGAIDIGAVRETITRLRSGNALAIFPEGARTSNGEMQSLERGISLIIHRTGVPVIPVAIDGSYQAWPMSETVFSPRKIRLLFGPPMELADLTEEQILFVIDNTLRGMLQLLRQSNHNGNHRISSNGRKPTATGTPAR